MEAGRVRFVSFSPKGFITFLKTLEDSYGSAGKAMIYSMAKTYGEVMMKDYVDNTPHVEGMTPENKMRSFLERIKSLGWGTMKISGLDLYKGEVDILLENQVFNEYCIEPGDMPQCRFQRALIEGLWSIASGQDLIIKESKCTGDKRDSCYYRMERNE